VKASSIRGAIRYNRPLRRPSVQYIQLMAQGQVLCPSDALDRNSSTSIHLIRLSRSRMRLSWLDSSSGPSGRDLRQRHLLERVRKAAGRICSGRFVPSGLETDVSSRNRPAAEFRNEKPGELEARRAFCCYPTLALGGESG
jgi:hypothetical protein